MSNNRIQSAMEKNEKTANFRDDDSEKEPEINYRGVKAMPFIIGKQCSCFYLFVNSLSTSTR